MFFGDLAQHRVHGVKGAVVRIHENPAHHVHDGNHHTAARLVAFQPRPEADLG